MNPEIPTLLLQASHELKLLESFMQQINDHGEVTGFCSSAETIDRQLIFALKESIQNTRILRSRIQLNKLENSENE